MEAPSKEENLAVWNWKQIAWKISEDNTGITNLFKRTFFQSD